MRTLILSLLLGLQVGYAQITSKLIIHKGGGTGFLAFNNGGFRLLADSTGTGGAWSVVELTEEPGYKTPLHRHNTWVETFYVLQGIITAKIGDSVYHLPAGSYLQIPKGMLHGQANFGTVPLKLLLVMQPSGFERHLLDRVELSKTVKANDPQYQRHADSLRKKNVAVIEGMGTWLDDKNIPVFQKEVRQLEQRL